MYATPPTATTRLLLSREIELILSLLPVPFVKSPSAKSSQEFKIKEIDKIEIKTKENFLKKVFIALSHPYRAWNT